MAMAWIMPKIKMEAMKSIMKMPESTKGFKYF